VEVPLQDVLFAVRHEAHPRWAGKTQRLVTVKMEAIVSSETSVRLTRVTRRHIPEDNILCGVW
jgi:hypothetical protein